MYVSWHLNYLRPHPIHTHKYTQTVSQHKFFHINTHTHSQWREQLNSTHNTGWDTGSNSSCLSLNAHCRTCCSLGCHVVIVLLSHLLRALSNVHHWRQNLSPAGLTGWIKFGAVNHYSVKLSMTLISMQIFDLRAEIYSSDLQYILMMCIMKGAS